MTRAAVRQRCLDLPGAEETFPFGPETAVFKVGGKIFAILPVSGESVSLKCDPALAADLREAHSSVRTGYHLNKRHWNTIDLDGDLPDRQLGHLVVDSYDLVLDGLPKRVQRELGWPPAA